MSLQERTLVVKNFDAERTTYNLLKELCLQAGPVRNVVIKPDHAFVEYEDVESVGYSKALLDGIEMFGRKLILEPKLRNHDNFKYTQLLQDYIKFDKRQREMQQELHQQQLMVHYQHQHQQQQQQQQQLLIRNSLPNAQPLYVPPQISNSFTPFQYPTELLQTAANPSILHTNPTLAQLPPPQPIGQFGNQPINYFQPQPSTSNLHKSNINLGRSQSFNYPSNHQNSEHNSHNRNYQNRHNRSDEWVRRRK